MATAMARGPSGDGDGARGDGEGEPVGGVTMSRANLDDEAERRGCSSSVTSTKP